MDSFEKKVDESWKEQVQKERDLLPAKESKGQTPQQPQSPPRGQAPREAPAGDFSLFLSSLSMQAMMALGEVPHPATNAPQEDLEQARYLVDILGLLQEKTKGNLTQEESSLLEGVLYELRMKYVAKMQGSSR